MKFLCLFWPFSFAAEVAKVNADSAEKLLEADKRHAANVLEREKKIDELKEKVRLSVYLCT